eukprot:349990-Chlamydomonas_euryale.AAC.4
MQASMLPLIRRRCFPHFFWAQAVHSLKTSNGRPAAPSPSRQQPIADSQAVFASVRGQTNIAASKTLPIVPASILKQSGVQAAAHMHMCTHAHFLGSRGRCCRGRWPPLSPVQRV